MHSNKLEQGCVWLNQIKKIQISSSFIQLGQVWSSAIECMQLCTSEIEYDWAKLSELEWICIWSSWIKCA